MREVTTSRLSRTPIGLGGMFGWRQRSEIEAGGATLDGALLVVKAREKRCTVHQCGDGL